MRVMSPRRTRGFLQRTGVIFGTSASGCYGAFTYRTHGAAINAGPRVVGVVVRRLGRQRTREPDPDPAGARPQPRKMESAPAMR